MSSAHVTRLLFKTRSVSKQQQEQKMKKENWIKVGFLDEINRLFLDEIHDIPKEYYFDLETLVKGPYSVYVNKDGNRIIDIKISLDRRKPVDD